MSLAYIRKRYWQRKIRKLFPDRSCLRKNTSCLLLSLFLLLSYGLEALWEFSYFRLRSEYVSTAFTLLLSPPPSTSCTSRFLRRTYEYETTVACPWRRDHYKSSWRYVRLPTWLRIILSPYRFLLGFNISDEICPHRTVVLGQLATEPAMEWNEQ